MTQIIPAIATDVALHPLLKEVNQLLEAQDLPWLVNRLEPGQVLEAQDLPWLETVNEQGAQINDSMSRDMARVSINQQLRRRLLDIEDRVGINLIDSRAFLYDDMMESLWLGQLKLNVIPVLKQHQS